jgi:hypothetical protein
MIRITLAHLVWIVSDWLESAREFCLDLAGELAGMDK